MEPINRSSKKILLTAALCALAAALLYGVLFAQVKKKNERTSALINEIELNAKQENVLASISALVIETAPLREKLGGYRVARSETASFIEMLESLGREAGALVTIESVETVARAAPGAAEDLRLFVRFEGGWQSVVRFLGLLELLPVESRIEQALISRKSAGSEKYISLWRGDVMLLVLTERS